MSEYFPISFQRLPKNGGVRKLAFKLRNARTIVSLGKLLDNEGHVLKFAVHLSNETGRSKYAGKCLDIWENDCLSLLRKKEDFASTIFVDSESNLKRLFAKYQAELPKDISLYSSITGDIRKDYHQDAQNYQFSQIYERLTWKKLKGIFVYGIFTDVCVNACGESIIKLLDEIGRKDVFVTSN
ncbi:MAG: hypothetical protein NTV88_04420, partial [Candidatus Micrarchaeota archaeon]|nr:hypothetical protein [Candidatus Micrarchaeota archaeon]